jgi:hypothetical protein
VLAAKDGDDLGEDLATAAVRPPTVMAEVRRRTLCGVKVLTAALLLHAVPSRSGSILGPSILPCSEPLTNPR